MKKRRLLAALAGVSTILAVYACSSAVGGDKNRMDRIEKSQQFEAGKFKNPKIWNEPPLKEWGSTTWEFLFKDNQRVPKQQLPRKNVDLSHFESPAADQLNVTWLGHSNLMINIDGYKIITGLPT